MHHTVHLYETHHETSERMHRMVHPLHCIAIFFYTQYMASLHEVTDYTKQFLKYFAIFLGVAIVVFFGFRLIIGVKEFLFPTPPDAPTVTFGKLLPIEFPASKSSQKFEFTIDTVSGKLPQTIIGTLPENVQKESFPDRVNIYPLTEPQPNLLALQNVQSRVEQIGFISPGTAITPNIYSWSDLVLPDRTMTFDIVTLDFNLTSDYIHNPDSLASEDLPNEEGAKNIAQNFLQTLSVFPDNIDSEKTKTTLLRIENSALVLASSLATSALIQVDFHQKDIDTLPIVYPKPPFSTMNVFVGGGRSEAQIVESHFVYQQIASPSATYPIKTAKEAFDELKNNKAYIPSYEGTSDMIRIKNVFLAYYLGEKRQRYLMPIIVFEGNEGFYAYVSAIKNDLIIQ